MKYEIKLKGIKHHFVRLISAGHNMPHILYKNTEGSALMAKFFCDSYGLGFMLHQLIKIHYEISSGNNCCSFCVWGKSQVKIKWLFIQMQTSHEPELGGSESMAWVI